MVLMNLFAESGIEMQMERMDLWTWGKERVGRIESVALK